MRLTFVTGNQQKLREARSILVEHEIVGEELDLPERQSLDPKEIIEEKLAAAGKECFVEDVSFWIGDTGFPGPLFKFLLRAVGREGILRFAHAFGASRARAECTVGLSLGGEHHFFTGTVEGTLVEPRGDSGFGFDPIFVPDGHNRSFAEMSTEEKNAVSHRRTALEQLREHLAKRQ